MTYPLPATQGNGFYRFTIGDFPALVIPDGAAPFPVPAWPMWSSNAPKDAFEAALQDHFLPTDHIDMHFNTLFVDTGTERVLIDAGPGALLGKHFGQVATNLRRAGIPPESITLVLVSHGHNDHIGGLLNADGMPVLPNARYVWNEDEWKYWNSDEPEAKLAHVDAPDDIKYGHVRVARRVLPALQDRTELVPAGALVTPGIQLVPAPGHTPHMSAVRITSHGESLLYLADVLHHPASSLAHPDWSPVFDDDAAHAVETRRTLLDQAAGERQLVMAYHFPFPALGHVRREGEAYGWVPIAWRW